MALEKIEVFVDTGEPRTRVVAGIKGVIDEKNISLVQTFYALDDAFSDKGVKEFVFDINSPGGSIAILEQILVMVRLLKKRDVKIITHTSQFAASAAATLFGMGDTRIIHPRAYLMFHRSMTYINGKESNKKIKEKQKYLEELDVKYDKQMCENCGINYKKFMARIDKERDWYVPSEEALKHNFATEIDIFEVEPPSDIPRC